MYAGAPTQAPQPKRYNHKNITTAGKERMFNIKIISSIVVSLITMLLIYLGHDEKKNALIWILAIATTAISLILVIHTRYEEHTSETHIKETIAPLIRGIVSFNSTWFNMMAVEAKMPTEQLRQVTEDKLNQILGKIHPHTNSPIVTIPEKKQINWLEFFFQLCEQTNNRIKEVFSHSSKTDSALIKILSKIENSYLYKDIQLQAHQGVDAPNLQYELKFIYEYFDLINQLDAYYATHLKDFDDGSLQNAMRPFME